MLDIVHIEGLLVSKRLSIIPTVFYTQEQNTNIAGARILSCSLLEQPLHLYELGYKQCLRIIKSIMEYIQRNFCHAGHFLFPSPTLTIHCQVFMGTKCTQFGSQDQSFCYWTWTSFILFLPDFLLHWLKILLLKSLTTDMDIPFRRFWSRCLCLAHICFSV